MSESEVGFSVNLTRQCSGIGCGGAAGAPPARPRPPAAPAAAGGAPPARAGGGGGVKTPAGTTSADMTVVCAVDIVRIDSQLVGKLAASKSAAAIISPSFLLPTSHVLVRSHRGDRLRRVLWTRRDVRGNRDEIVGSQIG